MLFTVCLDIEEAKPARVCIVALLRSVEELGPIHSIRVVGSTQSNTVIRTPVQSQTQYQVRKTIP